MKWKELTKIGITGSRRFKDTSLAVQYMEKYIRRNFDSIDDVVIITGGALGVDSAIESLCLRQGIKLLMVPAQWLALERAAGPIRNKVIVQLSNEMMAFWDLESPGTKQCIDYAREVGKPITVWTVKKLRKELNVPPPPIIKIPGRATEKQAHQMRELIASADVKNLFNDIPRKKKRKFKWRST